MPYTKSATHTPLIGGTCICLYVILLVNACEYLLVWKGKDNRYCKTFLLCRREMNLSRKFFLNMLKINGLVIKLSLALCLVCIYFEYMYMCVNMCIMNLHVPNVCVYLSLCFLVIFVIDNDYVILFIYHTKV